MLPRFSTQIRVLVPCDEPGFFMSKKLSKDHKIDPNNEYIKISFFAAFGFARPYKITRVIPK